jgi:hypothetical protein
MSVSDLHKQEDGTDMISKLKGSVVTIKMNKNNNWSILSIEEHQMISAPFIDSAICSVSISDIKILNDREEKVTDLDNDLVSATTENNTTTATTTTITTTTERIREFTNDFTCRQYFTEYYTE